MLLLLACSAEPTPTPLAEPELVTAPTPQAGFDCLAYATARKVPVAMCSESPRLPGLWFLTTGAGGHTQTVAVLDGKPGKGGAAAVAKFFRVSKPWEHPVTSDDIAGVLNAFMAYPPGFERNSPATFTAPFSYTLTATHTDWRAHGGPNAVAGAPPSGPMMRATLSGSESAPIQWVIESGDGNSWAPTATIQWDRGPS